LAIAVFKRLCPVCGGEISSERLKAGMPCIKCLPENSDTYSILKNVTSSEWGRLVSIGRKVEELDTFFKESIGSRMWSAQKLWAKRVFLNKSFAIIAPTGSGKTVFGILLSLYLASRGKKVLFVLPTSILVEQVSEKAENFKDKVGLSHIELAYYHSFLSKKNKEKMLATIKNGKTSIIIVTSNFISRYSSLLSGKKFDLVFVDDVDSILRSSKIFDKILTYIGFDDKTINLALKLLDAKTSLNKARRLGLEEEVKKNSKKVDKLTKKLKNKLKNRKTGILIVSGASLRGRRTKRVKLFRELLGFDVGSKTEYLRNIVDVYVNSPDIEGEIVRLVKKLGPGGIIFVPQDKGLEYVRRIDEILKKAGIRSEAYLKPRKGILKRFSSGESDVLVGIASYRSPLTRGIDLPQVIKYVIFAGVPKFKISLNIDDFKPSRMIILLANLRDFLDKKTRYECDRYIVKLRNLVMLYKESLDRIIDAIKTGKKLEGFEGYAQKIILSIYDFLNRVLSDREVIEKIKSEASLKITIDDDGIWFILADPIAYIQGSGRTSRLYSGGISKGLAITVIDDNKAFKQLNEELSNRLNDFEWKNIKELDLNGLIKEISKERELIKAILEERAARVLKDPVKTYLLIVESPNKARTISRFYGVPAKRTIENLLVYEINAGDKIIQVTATGGHLLDLVTNEGIFGIRVENGRVIPVYSTIKKCLKCREIFVDDIGSCPKCGSKAFRDSIDVIKALRSLAFEVDEVLIGTDPDSEGEKIAWDVALALKPYAEKIRRIEFHEVTLRAINEALKKPREINENLVKAQIVRRIEDRWIGFGLSVIVQEKFDLKSLSAGRVQTPVLGWIIEKYIGKQKSKIYIAQVKLNNGIYLNFDLKVQNGWEARRKIKELANKEVKVEAKEKEVEEIKPPPPYTTDSLLKDAAAILGMSADKTMRIAQELFEMGLITYHRTDSIRVSPLGISIAKKYISEKFGSEFYQGRSWAVGGQGAHECIRPTRAMDNQDLAKLIAIGVLRLPRKLTRDHYALYSLIFNRFIASQMKTAKVIKTLYSFRIDSYKVDLAICTGIKEPGFTLVMRKPVFKEIDSDKLTVSDIKYIKSSKIKILTQGDTIALMKEKGLGRPSTYAKTISTLLKRRYVISVGKRGYLIPVKRGMQVYDFLSKNFPELVSEKRTRELLQTMDKIEEGQIDYQKVLQVLKEDLTKLRVLR